jgi:hypothetical protein
VLVIEIQVMNNLVFGKRLAPASLFQIDWRNRSAELGS